MEGDASELAKAARPKGDASELDQAARPKGDAPELAQAARLKPDTTEAPTPRRRSKMSAEDPKLEKIYLSILIQLINICLHNTICHLVNYPSDHGVLTLGSG